MSQATPKRRRRWFQFSLRTLLIGTAAVAVLVFVYVKTIEPYRLRSEITKLGGTYKTEAALGWVRYLDKDAQDVVVVDLADCDRPDEYLPHLARLPRLRTLVIGGHAVRDEQVKALRGMASLRGLVLDSTLVTDECIEGLKGKLPALEVYRSERRACTELKKVGATVHAFLYDSWDQTSPPPPRGRLRNDVGDVYFANCALLVDMAEAPATDAHLSWLASLQDVREIDATHARVNGTFLTHVVLSSSLTRLHLAGTAVTDTTLAHVSRFLNLERLNCRRTGISDDGCQYVATLRRLRELDLSDTRITDAGLAVVAELPSLEELGLRGTLVTDDGLGHLERSKTLKRLALTGTRITDASVPILEKMAQLTDLEIAGTGISPSGVRSLKLALPQCSIHN